MQTIYEADDPVLAHLLVGVLSQAGIRAQVLGDHLQGAMGELPAQGLIRVVVPEAQVDEALDIVDDWEDAILTEEDDDLCLQDALAAEARLDAEDARARAALTDAEGVSRGVSPLWWLGLGVVSMLAWWLWRH